MASLDPVKVLEELADQARRPLAGGVMSRVRDEIRALLPQAVQDIRAASFIPQGQLHQKTGNLSRGFVGFISAEMNQVSFGVRNTARGAKSGKLYANVQESGGWITTQKYMVIPFTRNGVPDGASPRDYANTYVRRLASGNLGIFQRDTGLLFTLTKAVFIPARLNFYRNSREILRRVAEMAIDRVWRGGLIWRFRGG